MIYIVSPSSDMLTSFVPMTLDRHQGSNGTLYGHFANSNDMCQLFGRSVLVTFLGPHGYISPKYYGKARTMMVPTWNYVVVECKGVLKQTRDISKDDLFAKLVSREEQRIFKGKDQWKMEDLSPRVIDPMKKAVTWFEIEIAEITGRFKLSQNKTKEMQLGIADCLFDVNPDLSIQMSGRMLFRQRK
jgi:transcriptional regulator